MRKPLRLIAAALILSIGVSILALITTENTAGNRDFVSYWATGQQLVHRANPFDGPGVLRIEQGAGFTDNRPFFARNLPSAFFLFLPLGFLGERAAAILWTLALAAALMAAVRLLWLMNGRQPDRLHLIAYVFPPAFACLLAGQLGILMLLGLVLFLYFRESRPFLAGSALLLCSLKPHLFLPFGIVLLAWMISRRAYRIMAGTGFSLFASVALSFVLDPSAWAQYGQMMRASRLQAELLPTVSTVFRLIVNRDFTWLQFVPAALGSIWALRYFWTHRERWDWAEHGSLLLLVSVTVAPYAWFTDETVLLPAIMFGLYRANRSLIPFACIAGLALIEVFFGAGLSSPWYLWTAPAWLIWYPGTGPKTLEHPAGQSTTQAVPLQSA